MSPTHQITCAALMPNPHEPGMYWLLDVARQEIIEQGQGLEQVDTLICLDGKEMLSSLQIDLLQCPKLICLSTIKKLISKDHRAEVEIPQWQSANEALLWVVKALEKTYEEIDRRQIGALVQLECALIPVLVHMERAGLPFNKEKWLTALELIAAEQQQIKRALEPHFQKDEGFLLFGPEAIDLNQTSVVKERLENIIGRKLSSTSASVLKDIDHEAARLLMRYREHERMLTTYGEHFLPKIVNNRLHATFVAIASASGRSTCLNPNLQALPGDPVFQACVEPEAPNRLLYFDYGGFELRILAALSKDQELCQIFNDDRDIHSVVAEALFHTEVSSEKNPHLRAQAKILNFGIIYGMGEKALAHELKASPQEAHTLMKSYFSRFSKVRQFLDGLEAQVKKRGFVETALGRRAYLDGSSLENQGHILRVARNIPIQGTGAEITKLALVRVFNRFKEQALAARIVNMIHDEIVVECHEDQIDSVKRVVLDEMSQAFNAILPGIKPAVSAE